jgi:hypothetical protein
MSMYGVQYVFAICKKPHDGKHVVVREAAAGTVSTTGAY